MIKIFLCDSCGWKKVAEESSSGLKESNNDSSGKKYKCPSCGRAIVPRKCLDPQADLDRKKKEQRIKKENERWLEDSEEFQKKFINDQQQNNDT
jgi:predicted RNA-binding Zn-ribbon protein involved in translation (DUF1610 family)